MTAILVLISGIASATDECSSTATKCDNTTLGRLEYMWGRNSSDNKSHVLLNGNDIFNNNSSQIGEDVEGWVLDKNNKTNKVVVYYRFNEPKQIAENLYRYRAYRLFDFSGEKVIISNEFYPPADYEAPLRWVSWGQKNSVIAFDDGSRFKYENGHVTMIDDGSKTGESE
ncbi:hypothetical protein [Kosakonia oryzae]|uniref:hypothetical protein n=1 Tax=Kosakonia oryzae TaxID=497725 RepID=UPI001D0900FD|nr:hypothetical protein [Kosakonia oryzae]